MTTLPGYSAVVLHPLHADDAYFVRVVNDRDGDEVFCTEPSPSLDAALDEANWLLEPWEVVGEVCELEEIV